MTETQRIRALKHLPFLKGALAKVKPLVGGFTNHSYLVEANGKKYVARFAPRTSKILRLDRRREVLNQRQVARLGIGAELVAHYRHLDLLVVDYLPGRIMTPQMARRPGTIRTVAAVLRSLHKRSGVKGSLDPVARARHYVRVAQEKKGWLPNDLRALTADLQRVVKAAKPLSKQDPCHLDLMLQNILISPGNKVKLLDWEYASRFDYRYDLAMFSVKGGFQETEDRLLATAYGSGGPHYLKTRLPMKALVHFAEASYGLLQSSIAQKKTGHKEYAIKNFGEFSKLARRIGKEYT